MGIFTRFRDIVQANINSMLDKAEDPGKMVKLMIQEIEDTLVELKASCAGSMAEAKKVRRALNEINARGKQWEEKARLAVSKGREDLAREALLEKRRYHDRSGSLQQELATNSEFIERYQEDITQLEVKLANAREKQRILIQRQRQAEKKNQAQKTIRKVGDSDVMTRFEQFENRIDRMEAEADLVNYGKQPTLEDEFAQLETDEEIERELQALKEETPKKSGKEKPSNQ